MCGKCKCCKCCKSKACCDKLCIPVWVVILTGIALAVCLPLLDCWVYFELSFYEKQEILFWVALGTIIAEVVFAIIFLILIKIGATHPCFQCFKNTWLLLHLILLSVLAILIFRARRPKAKDLCEILQNQGKIKTTCERSSRDIVTEVPEYIEAMQQSKNCCGIYDYTDYGDPPGKQIMTCNEGSYIYVGPPFNFQTTTSTSTSTNMTMMTTTTVPEPIIPFPPSGCLYKLEEAYENCIVATYKFILIMLVIGVIPYVCFTLAYRQRQKEEELENDEDEDED